MSFALPFTALAPGAAVLALACEALAFLSAAVVLAAAGVLLARRARR
jgi:hypothetical protein